MTQKRERLWNRDYIIVMLAAMGTSFCNYFFFTGMPLYAEKLTGSTVYVGITTAAYSLAALVIRPVAGVLSDRIGRVKILMIGAAICTLACIGYGLSASLLLLLVFRALNGMGFGMHSTCAGAVVADVTPPSRMTEGIGFFGLYGTVAQAIAPTIALALIGGKSMGEFRTLFFVSAAICAVSFLCDSGISYERKRRRAGANPDPGDRIVEKVPERPLDQLPKTFLGFEYAVFLPTAVILLAHTGLAAISSFVALHAEGRGITSGVGMYFTVSAAGVLVSRFLLGRIVDRRGADVVVLPGLVVMTLSLVLLGYVRSLPALLVLAFPNGLAQGAVSPTMNSLLFRRCSPQRRGTASAAFFAAIDIGFTIGPILLGLVAEKLGYTHLYWLAGVFTALAFVFYLLFASDRATEKRAAARGARTPGL